MCIYLKLGLHDKFLSWRVFVHAILSSTQLSKVMTAMPPEFFMKGAGPLVEVVVVVV